MGGSQLQASRFLIEIAEMLLDSRVSAHVLRGLGEIVFRQVVLTQLEIGPAERIEIRAIRRL